MSICLLFLAVVVQAQIQEPVRFKSEFNILSGRKAEIVFTAAIDKGWHVYSTGLGDGGPISATFNIDKISGAIAVGKLQAKGREIASYDKLFEMNVRYFEGTAQFVQELSLSGGDYQVQGYLEYGACNDENCLPPTQVEFDFKGKAETKRADAAAPTDKPETPSAGTAPDGQAEASADAVVSDGTDKAVIGKADGQTSIVVAEGSDLWQPVISETSHRRICRGFISLSPVSLADCWHCSLLASGLSFR